MFFAHESDVLVVGGGPAGLATALMLAERGISVELIEEEATAERHNYAVQLHPSALRVLDDAGVANELLPQGVRVDTVEIWDQRAVRARLDLRALGGEFPYVLVLSRNVLETALERHARERKVPVAWSHRLADLTFRPDRAEARIERLTTDSGGYSISTTVGVVDKELRRTPRYVIGADGFHSTVRRRAGFEIMPLGPSMSFAACEFVTDVDLGSVVRVVFAGDTTSVLWPLPGGRCRWVMQLARELPENTPVVHVGQRLYPQAPRGLIEAMVSERAPWFRGLIQEVRWAAQVRFDPFLAERFGHGRTWLVGDAAHVTGPVGVQSLNAALQEAHLLASRLARVMRDGEPAELLTRYSQEQRAEWERLMGLTGGLQPRADTDPWVAEHRERLLPCLPAVGDDLVRLADQLQLDVGERR